MILISHVVDGTQKKRILQKVLFRPDLRRNLFSIGLASKAGLSFQTLGDKCALFQDLSQGPKVMEGVQTGTLYKLLITPIPSTIFATAPSTTFAVTTHKHEDITLWHNRMGHVNMQVLKTMSTHKSLDDFTLPSHAQLSSVCKGCALGKQHKATYSSPPAKERSKIPGEKLHADLCDMISLAGALCYMLIKDDCTSYRFVAFLKNKNDAIRFFYQNSTLH